MVHTAISYGKAQFGVLWLGNPEWRGQGERKGAGAGRESREREIEKGISEQEVTG